MKQIFLIFALSLLVIACGRETYDFPFLNPNLSIEERVDDLVSRMTLQEKIDQLNYEAPAIGHLGVPAYNYWNECLHGVARSGLATVYPQAIGMAASFDSELFFEVAEAISMEGRAKYNYFRKQDKRGIYQGITFWTPHINIFRDPRWGRGMETYGEDPFLTGKLAVQFIKGIQGDDPNYLRAVATAKHFAVHSGPEPERHSFNADVSEFDLWDTYLPAFKMAIEEADVASVMCAYNRFRDEACCASDLLLQDILRNQWNFDGYVVTDCWALVDFYEEGHHEIVPDAPQAAALGFKKGSDLNCGNVSPYLAEAVESGLISEEEIEKPLKRVLESRFRMGMFDPENKVPFNEIPHNIVDSKAYQQLALEMSEKSMVLLKNENNTLPLSKELKNVAVIGPNADDVEVLLANYNGIPSNPITPLQGIRNILPNAQVNYALGARLAQDLPVLQAIPASFLFTDETMTQAGLQGEYYDNTKWEGEPRHSRIDTNVDFYWWDKAPFEDLDEDDFSVRWSGIIVPDESGKYAIGAQGFHGYNLYFEDSLLLQYHKVHRSEKEYEFVEMEAGKPYAIQIEYYDQHGDAEMRLLWEKPGCQPLAEAVEVAKEADVVVLCMGLSPRLEGEEMPVRVDGFNGGDREIIGLPESQKELIQVMHALDKPIVLVLMNGSAVEINWADENIPAILEAWYPGQAGGTAIANVLFGDHNPAGRLPLTFYKSVNDLPAFDNYDMQGRTYRYFDGEPLYPFGFGLSYTTFDYKEPALSASSIRPEETTTLTVSITNSGKIDGDEVVQLYVKDLDSKEQRPIKTLRGFSRVHIAKGESKEISFEIGTEQLQYYCVDKQQYTVEAGRYQLMVGKSSMEKDLKSVILTVE